PPGRFDDSAGDGTPQAEAAVARPDRLVRLAERLEDRGERAPVDADARVGHGHLDPPVLRIPRAHANLPALGRELRRVPEKVPERLLQAPEVTLDVIVLRLEGSLHP